MTFYCIKYIFGMVCSSVKIFSYKFTKIFRISIFDSCIHRLGILTQTSKSFPFHQYCRQKDKTCFKFCRKHNFLYVIPGVWVYSSLFRIVKHCSHHEMHDCIHYIIKFYKLLFVEYFSLFLLKIFLTIFFFLFKRLPWDIKRHIVILHFLVFIEYCHWNVTSPIFPCTIFLLNFKVIIYIFQN